eukprot:jgi/Hompol1/3783/HPOL_006808-RA
MDELRYPTDTKPIVKSLLRVCLINRQDKAAMEWFKLLMTLDTSTDPYNEMIGSYISRGDGSLAVELLEKMKREGPLPDLLTYETISQSCLDIGDAEASLAWINEFRNTGATLSLAMATAYMAACNRLGKFQDAVDMVEECRRCGVRFLSSMHIQAILAYAGIKDRETTWSLFVKRLESSQPSQAILRAIAAMEGPINPTSLRLIDESIKKHGLIRPETLTWLAMGYMQLGDVASTKMIADVYEAQSERIKAVPLVRKLVVSAYCHANDIQGALDYIDKQYSLCNEPLPFKNYYATLGRAIELGSFEHVKELLKRIKKDYPKEDMSDFYKALEGIDPLAQAQAPISVQRRSSAKSKG